MALLTKLGTVARDGACNGIVDLLDLVTPPAVIRVRTGAAPTNVADASSGTLLGTLTMQNPAFGNSSVGVATNTASITSDSSADASGDAGHARVYQGAGADTAAIMQFNAGNAGDTVNMTFDNKTIVAGGVLACSSFTVTVPVS